MLVGCAKKISLLTFTDPPSNHFVGIDPVRWCAKFLEEGRGFPIHPVPQISSLLLENPLKFDLEIALFDISQGEQRQLEI